MKLSIVIPAYNEENYLAPCLAAVRVAIEQASREVEVIVVNNASTDQTKEVALSSSGVQVVDEGRRGITWARQAGYLASSGDLIANIDADTRMPVDWISKVFKYFESDPKLVVLSGPYIYYDFSKFKNCLGQIYYRIGYAFNWLTKPFNLGAMVQGGNFVLRRSALEKIGGFDTNIDFYGEDTDIAVRAKKYGKMLFTFKLPMYSSARRLKQEGFFTMARRYSFNYFYYLIFKKPYTKKHLDIRS